MNHKIVFARQPREGFAIQSQLVLPDVASDGFGDRHIPSIIAAHQRITMDKRGHPVPRGHKARADLAADQPGGTRHENAVQQQPPPLATCGAEPTSGKSVPQSG